MDGIAPSQMDGIAPSQMDGIAPSQVDVESQIKAVSQMDEESQLDLYSQMDDGSQLNSISPIKDASQDEPIVLYAKLVPKRNRQIRLQRRPGTLIGAHRSPSLRLKQPHISPVLLEQLLVQQRIPLLRNLLR